MQAQGHHLALELFGGGPRFFQQGHLRLHRGVNEQQAVQGLAGGEDLFCILKTQTHSITVNMIKRFILSDMCLCVGHLLVERDDQLHAVFIDEGGDITFVQLLVLRHHEVCSALVELSNRQTGNQ